MKTRNLTQLTFGLTIMIMLGLVGCAEVENTDANGFVARVVDSISEVVAEHVEGAIIYTPEQDETTPEIIDIIEAIPAVAESVVTYPYVEDIVIDQSFVYAATPIGLAVVNLADKSEQMILSGEPLSAVVMHLGKLYIGGNDLYEQCGDSLISLESGMIGSINVMLSHGAELIVGTTFGLYTVTDAGTNLIVDQFDISALTADQDGLWVGTNGNGLFHYDGDEFVQRWLARDKALFDQVTSLAYNHNRLYLGTPDAFFIYNGGVWNELTVEDGLPAGAVRSIDASGWVVYVATDNGIAGWHNEELTPVDRLETVEAEVVRRLGRKLLVGTKKEGLVLKSGPVVRSLLQPIQIDLGSLATMAH